MSAPGAAGARPLNAITVDVEEHFQVSAFAGAVARQEWGKLESRVEASTARVLELLDEAGVQATFFVLGWIAEHHPRLVRRIADCGHEIASHGYAHRLVYDQTPDEFGEELTRTRRILEDASGGEVVGFRAASFSITRRSLWALDLLAETGYRYDSSVFPVLHDRYGIPGAPRGPYRVSTRGGRTLLELPPATVRLGRLVLPVAGGGYLRLYPLRWTDWAVRRLNVVERLPAVVYVHPWEFDPDQPRIRAPWRSRLRHYTGLATTAGKLRRLLAGHRFGSMRQLIASAPDLPLRKVA